MKNELHKYVNKNKKKLKISFMLADIGITDGQYRTYIKKSNADLPTWITEKIKELNGETK